MSARSVEAAAYAAKKRAALERANQLRREREEREEKSLTAGGLQHQHSSSTRMRQVTVESYPSAERIIIHERIFIHNPGLHNPVSVRDAPVRAKPKALLAATASASIFRSSGSGGVVFNAPPAEAAGREYDLSGRPLLCSSSFFNSVLKRREIVFGGADHALYCIQSVSPANHPSPVVKMYSKQFGHSDWVTSVAHLSDGRVISSAMDGKLCLWELNKRRCSDLLHHTKSVSKVVSVASSQALLCVSASYDCTLAVWNFGSIGSSGGATPVSLTGHKSAVLELTVSDGIIASGGRDGAVVTWDLLTGQQLHRVRGHEAPITGLRLFSPNSSSQNLISGAADGTIKLWDPRAKELVTSGVPHPGAPITGLLGLGSTPEISGAVASTIMTAGADGVLLFFDLRKGFKTPTSAVHRFDHARNGIYAVSLSEGQSTSGPGFSEGESSPPTLFVGDGVGTVLCYDLSSMTLRYGLGSSRIGAIRCISAFRQDRVMAVGNEDGKCLIYDF